MNKDSQSAIRSPKNVMVLFVLCAAALLMVTFNTAAQGNEEAPPPVPPWVGPDGVTQSHDESGVAFTTPIDDLAGGALGEQHELSCQGCPGESTFPAGSLLRVPVLTEPPLTPHEAQERGSSMRRVERGGVEVTILQRNGKPDRRLQVGSGVVIELPDGRLLPVPDHATVQAQPRRAR